MSAVSLWAQEDLVELDDYAVEAQGLVEAADLMVTGVEVLDPAASERQATGSLGEVLSWEPGISSSFYGAGASRPIVRGMGGYRVGVFDGGLSTGDLSATSPDHAVAIEPLFIRAITVHRGAAALVHGGGSIGGAVDTEPDFLPRRDTAKGASGELGAIYETVNEGQTAFLKSGQHGEQWAVRVNLLTRETDDYAIPGLARTPEYDVNNRLRLPPGVQGKVAPNPEGSVPNTWTQTRVGALGLGWFQPTWSTQATYQHYASEYGVPLDGHTHGNPFGEPGVTGPGPNDAIVVDLEQNRLLAQGEVVLGSDWIDSFQIKGALTDFRQTESEGLFLANDFSLEGGALHLEGTKQWGRWRFFSGVEVGTEAYRNRNLSYNAGRADEDILETSSVHGAAFALAEVQGANTALRLGGRWDRRTAERDDRRGFSRSDSAGGIVAEISQMLGGQWQAALSLAETARLANADELYIEAPHGATGIFQLPNPELDKERVQSAELLLQRLGNRVRLSLSAFVRDFDGYIFLENQGFEVDGLTAYALVQRDARFYGGEVAARWDFLARTDWQGHLEAFADYVHATDTEQDEPLPRIPPLRLGGHLEAAHGPWLASVSALHAFRQDRVPREIFGTLAYQSPSEAYTLITLQLERRFLINGIEVFGTAQVSNAFDVEARQHTSFLKDVAPLPGRSLQLTLRMLF